MSDALLPVDARRLDDLYDLFQTETQRHLGYPSCATFDYSPLFRFLAFPLNNVGDPYRSSSSRLQTHELEREVVALFAEFTHAPPDAAWGYVTGGGTEGNAYGISLARELYPEGVVYHSEDTHYSVTKILRTMRVRNSVVRSRPDGAVDLDALATTIEAHGDRPAIVFVNVGTTMKGAIDDVAGVREVLDRRPGRPSYVHADAALSGMMLPFLVHPPPWDFAAGVDSISISGHKMIGSPFPCGVVLARKENVDRIARRVEYIGSLDTTLGGSRNALSPLFLWYALKTIGVDGFSERVRGCLGVAAYACERLTAAGVNAWRHPHSNTVVFDRPSDEVVRKWQLAAKGGIAHVVTMPQVTREHIDRLAADIEVG